MQGNLGSQWADVTLRGGDLWSVATVSFPDGEVTRVGGSTPEITPEFGR